MQAELNKYFPVDISNLILEKHYKPMFNKVLNFLNELIDDYRQEIKEITKVDDPDRFMHETGNTFAHDLLENIRATRYFNKRLGRNNKYNDCRQY